MQKTGAGMAWASSCIWDEETDGNCTVREYNMQSISRHGYVFGLVGKIFDTRMRYEV